jgi:hypothetical protein
MTVRGTIRRASIEGGLWILEAEGGKTYQLRGGPKAAYRDGARVEVVGDVDSGAVGIGMVGETLVVDSVRPRPD